MAREGDSRRSSREEAYRWERRRGNSSARKRLKRGSIRILMESILLDRAAVTPTREGGNGLLNLVKIVANLD
jgi:hypothetical protein